MSKVIRIAIDGNEANVKNRVGSNVYAFEILRELHGLTSNAKKFEVTVLLAREKTADLPPARKNWRYQVVAPAKLWTQWALPLHLFARAKNYDVFFTPGHYAPRWSRVPYISSVMDLAFLEFPEQFRRNDLFQLTHWTRYSVARAKKVITISEFSKKDIHEKYQKPLSDIIVASPAISLPAVASPLRAKAFFRKHNLEEKNYLLYVGTLQPRKNIERLIEAFEIFSRYSAANQLKKRATKKAEDAPPAAQLVLAGKVGWLAQGILDRIEASPLKEQIIITGFVGDDVKRQLYEQARVTVQIGLLEGFGIPPLESLALGTVPVVSNTSSLPEVVGNAGLTVDPTDPQKIANALKQAWNQSAHQRGQFLRRAKKQVEQFSWKRSAESILKTLEKVARYDR